MTPYIRLADNFTSSHKFLNVRLEVWISLALVCSTLAVYWQVHSFTYINYDSPEYVFDNFRVKAGLSIDNVKWAFTTTYFSNWHPLTWISHMLDVELYGLNPGQHHLINVLFHIINTLLLFYFLRKVSGQILPSAFVAGLFALHPLHIQSVAWIAERKDLLCTFFFLLTLISYIHYLLRPSYLRYCILLLFFILGLMAKPMIVTLPFILFLLDFWPLNRITLNKIISTDIHPLSPTQPSTPGVIIREKILLLILSFVSCLITFYAQKASGAVASVTDISLPDRIGNALVSYFLYIYKTVWPVQLAIIYPHPGTQPVGLILAATLSLFFLSFLFLSKPVKFPYLSVGWLWFLGSLVPVIGIIQVGVQAMADRYTYIPLTGLFIIFSWWIFHLFSKHKNRHLFFSIFATGILLLLSIASWNQLKYWQDSMTLLTRAIDITENNYIAHNNLGYQYIQNYQFDKAKEQFIKSLAIEPNFEIAHLNLGRTLVQEGKIENGITHYIAALKINPDYADAHNNLGNALLKLGHYRKAAHHYLQTIQLKHNFIEAYNNLGAVLILDGKYDYAIQILNNALEIDPSSLEAQVNIDTAIEAKNNQSAINK